MSQILRQGDKKLAMATKPIISNQVPCHNVYPDLKNKWAPNALEFDYSISDIFCFFIVVFLLGWLCSQLIMFAFKDTSETYADIEIIEPYYTTKIEELNEFIDYAALKNGGSILKDLSSPEYHGVGAYFTDNNMQAVISDDNSPQHCWPIVGNRGHIAIKLGAEIYPSDFTVVIPSIIYPTIPKEINVYNIEGDLLAYVVIQLNEMDLKIKNQILFKCQWLCKEPLRVIIVEITQNYGGKDTCLYQFKAHGLPSK